jgi:hypothetical protein
VTWVDAEDDGTEWGYSLLYGQDWIYPTEGTTSGLRTMVAPDGQTHEFRFYSGTDIKIELPEDAVAAIGDIPRLWRSIGLGRLRKDLSLPLMPPPDKIWIQSGEGDATLVIRPSGGEPAFFLLGPLAFGARQMAGMGIVPVLFLVGTNVLPDPSMRQEARAAAAGRAWGGLIDSTDELRTGSVVLSSAHESSMPCELHVGPLVGM